MGTQLFAEDDAPLLKQWIQKKLENTSDADSDILADYVLALLRHEGDESTVRELCEAEIPAFLTGAGESKVFIQDLFTTVHYRSYLTKDNPRRRPSMPFVPSAGPSGPFYRNMGPGSPMGPSSGAKKRSYNDRGDGEVQQNVYQNDRSNKQPRRGGAAMGRGAMDNFNTNGGRGGHGGRPPPLSFQGGPQHGFPGMPSPTGLPPFDPNNPLAAMLAMQQAMGLIAPDGQPTLPSFVGLPSPNISAPPRRSGQRCRDYDSRGFCGRGSSCPYDHGENPVWIAPGLSNEEYDPMNSSLMNGPGRGAGVNFRGSDRGRGRGGFQRGGSGQHGSSQFSSPRRGGRAEFSSDRPNFDKTKTRIVVESIPEEHFSEDAVRGYFSQFGNIEEVSMRPYKRLAIVKFTEYDSAQAAYNSPKVIFDTRFVKVYWFNDESTLPKPPQVPTSNGFVKQESTLIKNEPVALKSDTPAEPQIDLDEFARKQEEVQKLYEEKQKKKQEMELARKELEKRQQKQAEEKRKLMERIAAKSAKPHTTEGATQSGDETPETGRDTAQRAALKAMLAKLESEASQLGIQPEYDATSDGGYKIRGGYRGRGRGMRGSHQSRGYQGGRGRGRGGFSAGPLEARSFNIDNRPRKINMAGIDFTVAGNEESLRSFLLNIGEYTDLEITPDKTSITFKDRKTAENFMYGSKGEVPGVGHVEMAWIQTPLPPVNLGGIGAHTNSAKSIISRNGNNKDDDAHMGEGDAMAATSSPAHNTTGLEHETVDYDVADDNDWSVQ